MAAEPDGRAGGVQSFGAPTRWGRGRASSRRQVFVVGGKPPVDMCMLEMRSMLYQVLRSLSFLPYPSFPILPSLSFLPYPSFPISLSCPTPLPTAYVWFGSSVETFDLMPHVR